MARKTFVYAGREWSDPRDSRAWRNLRDQVVREEPLCRLRIAGVCLTKSTTADHIIPVAERPDLAMERSNHQGACQPCNEARGNLPMAALASPGPPAALAFFE